MSKVFDEQESSIEASVVKNEPENLEWYILLIVGIVGTGWIILDSLL